MKENLFNKMCSSSPNEGLMSATGSQLLGFSKIFMTTSIWSPHLTVPGGSLLITHSLIGCHLQY